MAVVNAPMPNTEAILQVECKVRGHRAESEKECPCFFVLQTLPSLGGANEAMKPPKPNQIQSIGDMRVTYGLWRK